MSFLKAVIALAALLGVALGCDSEKGGTEATGANGDIVIVPFRDLEGSECEGALNPSPEAPTAYPTPATARGIAEELGTFLAPSSTPAGMELKSRSLWGEAAFMVFESVEGQPKRVLSIAQFPTNGEVIRLHVKEGYYETATVRGAPAYVVRGTLVINAISVDGVERVEGCEWDDRAVTSVGFVSDGHAVRVAGSPGGEFDADELVAIAASLEEVSEVEGLPRQEAPGER